MNNNIKKILQIIDKLNPKPLTGGLHISNTALLFLILKNNRIVSNIAIKLNPGVIKNGIINDEQEFKNALNAMHQRILPNKPKSKIRVMVSIPSEIVYSQTFKVPHIAGESFDESVRLNFQMISPLSLDKSYFGWQILEKGNIQYELMGAVVSKEIIDKYYQLLIEANFVPEIFEFPALSLSRLIENLIGSSIQNKPLLVIDINNDGVDMFVFKNHYFYFNHFTPWNFIKGDVRVISSQAFIEIINDVTKKVINFYQDKFRENVRDVLLIAPELQNELAQSLNSNFGLKINYLNLGNNLSPLWGVVLGVALRTQKSRASDTDITLTPFTTVETYYQEKKLIFLRTWRNVILTVLLFFLIVYIISAVYMFNIYKQSQERVANYNSQPVINYFNTLKSNADTFNNLVDAITSAKQKSLPFVDWLNEINKLAVADNVTIVSISFNTENKSVELRLNTTRNDNLLKFKNDIANSPLFSNVSFPFSSRVVNPDNTISFTLNFNIK
ncbi:MAG: hypothetical protein ACP5IC_01445 [Minisyncoccia bacterium]